MRNPIARGWNVVDTSFRERPTDLLWVALGPYGFRRLLRDVRRERYRDFRIGRLHRERLSALLEVPLQRVDECLRECSGIARELGEQWPGDLGNMGHLKGALALYVITRLARPERIVETGVASGISTSFMLEAVARNGVGSVISIDVKNADNLHIPSARQTGWMIPERYRDRWRLVVGDSREILDHILQEERPIDLFLHDSLHTREHQCWEYERAWAALRPGGLLLSDNVETGAFSEFCQRVGAQSAIVHSVWRGPKLGFCRKPRA